VAASAAHAGAMKDLNALGGAIGSKAIAPLAQYQAMLGSVLHAGKSIGPGIVSALRGVSVEFARQRDLAAFWGVSGAMRLGVNALKSSLSGFLSGSGTGFTSWLQNGTAKLAEYRTSLVASAAVMVGMAAAAALSSKHTQNLISSVMDSKLMDRKFGEDGSARKEDALKWIESAQGNDLVIGGRESRMKTLQTVLSKNRAIGGEQAKKITQDIERYFYANQEELQGRGIANAADLASKISAPQLTGDDAAFFEDKFGLGFSNQSATARLGRLGVEAQGIDPEKELAKRPDVVLSERVTKTTQAMGDAVLPVLNVVLNGFVRLSNIIGQIPGLGAAMGWGAVLLGAATAGLVVVSMLGSLISGLKLMKAAVMGETAAKYANIAATYAHAAASKVAAAGQWLLNAAISANPLGIAIVAIAGLIAVLYYLETRFGVLTKAWQAFSNSSIGKGIFGYIESGKKAISEMLGSLGKAYASGGLKRVMHLALDALAANSPGLKVLIMIADFIRKLLANSAILNKLSSAGTQLLQRMVDFFTWLLETIRNGLAWIKDGLGITKKEKEAELAKTGASIGKAHGKVDAKGQGIPYEYRSNDPGGNGWYLKGSHDVTVNAGLSESELARLNAGKEKVENAPKSFFEAIPGIADLTKAIKDLIAQLSLKAAAATVNQAGQTYVDTTAKKYEDVKSKDGEYIAAQTTWRPWWMPGGGLYGMAEGGSIIGSGAIIGHQGEQVNPADVVLGGETTLEKINRMFSGTPGSSGNAEMPAINGPLVSVQIGKIEKDVDIDRLITRIGAEGADKLLFALRNKMENGSTRGIGYLRG
jgi:hypothetical protein